jgi:hypothetical protein
MRMTDLKPGWRVAGNDGQRLGTVREVGQNYLLVSTARLSEDLYVPASAIANIEEKVVHLNVAAREAGSMGWGQPPRDEDAPEGEQSDLHRHV